MIKKLIRLIVDFLSEIFSNHSKIKRDLYYIPVSLILKNLQLTSQNLIDLINNKNSDNYDDLGISIILDDSKIEKIRSDFNRFIKNRVNESSFNIKSASELMESDEISKDLITNDFKFSLKSNFSVENCRSGFLHIKSVSKFAQLSLKYRANIEQILKIFDWKKLEVFVAEILNDYHDYASLTNFRFSLEKGSKKTLGVISKTTKKPQKRFEIDVIAVKDQTILFIDVKHWKRTTDKKSSLSSAADFQSSRAVNFCQDKRAIGSFFESINNKLTLNKIKNRIAKKSNRKNKSFWVYPIVVYSGSSSQKISNNGIPLISMNELSDFILTFNENKSSYVKFKIKKIQIQTKI